MPRLSSTASVSRPTASMSLFADFYKREYPRLAGSLQIACGSTELAEELAQEAFARALNHWSRVAVMDKPSGWLYRVAFNLLRRSWKLRGRTYALDQAKSISPDTDERRDLVVALGKLPALQASAVVLRHVLDYSTEDAAAALEVTPGALRMLLSRGIKSLRQDINLELPDEEDW